MVYRFVDYLLEGSFGVLEESFKDYAKKHPGSEDVVTRFKELNARKAIKPPYHDISHWMNKETEELKSFLDGIKLEKTRKEIKKESLKNLVAENDEYQVFKIDNHEEVYALGKGTVWCIASGKKERSLDYYNNYTKSSSFYVAIKKQLGEQKMLPTAHGATHEGKAMIYPYWDKVAIQCKKDGSIIYWNTGDYNHQEGSEELSKVNLPKYNYKYFFIIPSNWIKNPDGTYDVDGDVKITYGLLFDGKFPVKFNKVKGNFDCYKCENLFSLEGAPESVGGYFDCHKCENLVSLEGAPKSVGGYFNCSNCPKLVSLEGAPESVGGYFNCSYCSNLVSLEGAPESVGGDFNCLDCPKLVSLEGAPESVGGYFDCYKCENLVSLEGAPKSVGGYFNCLICPKLVSLEGAPESVGGDFNCSYCSNLVSLEGAPESVGGYFDCSHCSNLVSLEGAPESVVGYFYCSRCPKLKLSELDKLPLSYRNRVEHNMKESTFYYWNKKYQMV